MRKTVAVSALAVMMSLSGTSVFAGSWWKVNEWFTKQNHSTTITGQVESIEGRKIMFKTSDGQVLELTGRKAEQIGEKRGATVRVFGNIRKPDAKFPSGGVDVRNFRVVEEAQVVAEPAPEPEPATEPAPEPMPEPMPEPAPAPEPIPEPIPEPAVTESAPIPGETGDAAMSGQASEYKVEKGDTLAKISKKVYGTTKSWKKIAEANGIKNPKSLKVGMTLQIPQ